jgi:hypothetical protein
MSRDGSRRVLRVEVATMIGSLVAGGALLPFGGTPARMALFLFGWSGGCAAHMLVQSVQRHAHRRPGNR